MTNQQLKDLEDKLWDAATSLRAYGGKSLRLRSTGAGDNTSQICRQQIQSV